MYGVLSFLSFFIQPWPKNSLYKTKCLHRMNKHITRKDISTFHVCPSLYPPTLTSTIFYLFTFVCVLVYTPECVTVCVCTVCVCTVCLCTYSYGMALKTRWSSSVSCSAISKAEWLSNGSVLESSMAWPQQQAEKSITTTKAKKKKGFILKRLFCGLFSPFVWSLRGWPGCLQDPPGLEFYTKEDITVIWSLIDVFFQTIL